MLLDCGDGVRLQGHCALQSGGRGDLVLLVHGWEGSAESMYVLSCAAYLYDRGFDVFRLNLRDHGASHHLNPELFHSCRLAEVVGAVRAVQALMPTQRLSLVGYSLGGNFALRVAVRAPEADLRLHRVVAVCPVLDPAHTLERLERGSWIYRHYFVLKWRASLQKKRRAWPNLYDLEDLLTSRDLTAMTEGLVLRYSGFPDMAAYLAGYALVGPALEGLVVPSTIVTALDDPIIPAADLTRLASPSALRILASPQGGHCGFLEGFSGESWADRQMPGLLTEP